jgi:hypothetical protein
MRRRDVITLLGGAAAAPELWPFAARAQKPRRMGVLLNGVETSPGLQANLTVSTEALRQLGWVTGQNLEIETRFNNGDAPTRTRIGGRVGQARAGRERIVGLVSRHRLPALYGTRLHVNNGGLMCRVGRGGACALPPPARSNGSCSFPASRFPVWVPARRRRRINAGHKVDQTHKSELLHQTWKWIPSPHRVSPPLGDEGA